VTDNEKAATFIGWKFCDGKPIWQNNPTLRFKCSKCERTEPDAIDLHRPAPNMSKPENYMRALQAVFEAGWCPCIEGDHHHGGSTWKVFFGHALRDATESVLDLNISEGVRRALAALYDAEHKENA